jgi:hypothetical protein
VYASYAKYRVDRGDLFVALARCLYDLKFKGADDKELGQVGVKGGKGRWWVCVW